MSRPNFTTDMSEFAGAVNSATPLKDNLQDIETGATALDWTNVTPESLDADHVETATALSDAESATASATYNGDGSGANNPQTIDSVTVTCETGAWITVFAQLAHAAAAATEDTSLIIDVDGATKRTVSIGNRPYDYGGGVSVWAFEATSTSHTVNLIQNSTTSPISSVVSSLVVKAFNR